MSEDEIKPVDGAIPARKFDGQLWIPADVAIELRSKDRATIDRLTTQLKHYQMAATAEANLADERHKEIKRLRAERDAAVAERDDEARVVRIWQDLHEETLDVLERTEKECDEAQRKLSVAVANGNALVADAERYRWLRQDAGFDGWTMPKSTTPCPDNIAGCKVQHHGRELSGSALDAAIDAARAEGGV